jgi:hypothetical protein
MTKLVQQQQQQQQQEQRRGQVPQHRPESESELASPVVSSSCPLQSLEGFAPSGAGECLCCLMRAETPCLIKKLQVKVTDLFLFCFSFFARNRFNFAPLFFSLHLLLRLERFLPFFSNTRVNEEGTCQMKVTARTQPALKLRSIRVLHCLRKKEKESAETIKRRRKRRTQIQKDGKRKNYTIRKGLMKTKPFSGEKGGYDTCASFSLEILASLSCDRQSIYVF